jgi:Trk K+ transport system NAD-binding subunit
VAISPARARSRPRSLHAQVLYLRALLHRFRFTFGMLFVLVVGGGALIWWLQGRVGHPMRLDHALLTAYFLLFAQVSALPESGPLELVYVLIPPLGIVTVAQGLVQFALLLFARQREDKEWFIVLAQTLEDHVIVCGAGRVGFRLFEQFQKLGVPMVVIERKADAPFVNAIRDAGVSVLIEDVRSSRALEQCNLARARAIVCATDDDLANLNIALDARRLKPGIRVVMRLFDDDLVQKTREAFEVEAFSTSALAAPALAVAALDARIQNSFEVGGRLMVIAEWPAGAALKGRTVGDLHTANRLTVLHLVRADGVSLFDPADGETIAAGDRVTVQATLAAWQEFQAKPGVPGGGRGVPKTLPPAGRGGVK